MHVCDFVSHSGRIRRATAELKERWQETLEAWNDETSRQFQEKYLEPLLPEVTLTLTAIQSALEQIHRAAVECEDPDRGEEY
jgi:uncharacterized protein YukE